MVATPAAGDRFRGLLGGPAPASTWRLILVPAVVTLAVTLLRLWGELKEWPLLFFSPAPGGGVALVGITWLVPVFGAWFALRLAKGGRSERPGRVIGFAALGLALVFAINFVVGRIKGEQTFFGVIGVFAVASVLGGLAALAAWPALGKTLLAYGLAARLPVALVMLLAIRGEWGTHYDLPPPDSPYMGPVAKWFWLGLLPQMTIWMAFTLIVGTLFGGLALLVPGRSRSAPPPRPSAPPVRTAPTLRPSEPLVRPAPPRRG
jgi:hypothetical protein